MQHVFARAARCAVFSGVLACALGASMAGQLLAQGPDASPQPFIKLVDTSTEPNYFHPSVDRNMILNRSERNSRRFTVMNICKGSEPMQGNEDLFDNWFIRYYYPAMSDPAELGNISKMRTELMRDYFSKIKNDVTGLQIRNRLNERTLNYLSKFVQNRLHPAVRYNAMLIIGDLDSRGPELFGTPSPAEPSNDALEFMLSELVSPTQIDAVRVAALIGIRRHAELNRYRPAARRWDDGTLRRVGEPIMNIASQEKPPASRTEEGHEWMRRLAVEILGELGATRPAGPITAVIGKIISDVNAPLSLRCAAAQAQGKILIPVPLGSSPDVAARQLARVGADAITSEMQTLKPYVDGLPRTGPGRETPNRRGGGNLLIGGGNGGADPGTEIAVEMDPHLAATQRRALHRLRCLQDALSGVQEERGLAAAAKNADNRQVVEEVIRAVEAALGEIETAPPGDPVAYAEGSRFLDSLAGLRESLLDLAPKKETASPAADGPIIDEGPATGPEVGPATGPEVGPEVGPAAGPEPGPASP